MEQKHEWLKAINKSIDHGRYGKRSTCTLCQFPKSCKVCICEEYALATGIKKTPYGKRDGPVPCVSIMSRRTRKKGKAVFGTVRIVRDELRKLQAWVEKQ